VLFVSNFASCEVHVEERFDVASDVKIGMWCSKTHKWKQKRRLSVKQKQVSMKFTASSVEIIERDLLQRERERMPESGDLFLELNALLNENGNIDELGLVSSSEKFVQKRVPFFVVERKLGICYWALPALCSAAYSALARSQSLGRFISYACVFLCVMTAHGSNPDGYDQVELVLQATRALVFANADNYTAWNRRCVESFVCLSILYVLTLCQKTVD
jgi:hypothetical protein